MGTRERAAELDFSAVALEEEVEAELKEAAVISMGTEIREADLLNIMALCDQARRRRPCSSRGLGSGSAVLRAAGASAAVTHAMICAACGVPARAAECMASTLGSTPRPYQPAANALCSHV